MKDIKDMNVAELTDHYNGLPGVKPVKKFKSVEEAQAAIKGYKKPEAKPAPAAKAEKAPKAEKPAKPAAAPKEPKVVAPWDLPFKGVEGKILHAIRGNTINAEMVALMSRKEGATMAELEAVVAKFDAAREQESKDVPGRARSLAKILHTYNGYDIKQKGDRFHLITK